MISSPDVAIFVGNLGWVDQGALWVYRAAEESEHRIAIEGTAYLGLQSAADGLFRLVHHQSPDMAVSLRAFEAPEVELASIRHVGGRWRFSGDSSLWQAADPAFLIQTAAGQKLLLVDRWHECVTELDLGWFNADTYDLGYQGPIGCLSIPEVGQIWVSVQRSSELAVIDPIKNRLLGKIALADRGGNPVLRHLAGGRVVASDYDTLCVLDIESQKVGPTRRLQEPAGKSRQFIGDYDIQGTTCAVARPFGGDVLLLDTEAWVERKRVRVAGQPLSVCLLRDDQFIVRDWKTGNVSRGRFT